MLSQPLALPTEYREIFYLFDKNGDKKIGLDQIGEALRALGLNPTERDIQKITEEIDPEGRGHHPAAPYHAYPIIMYYKLFSNSSH